MRKQMFSVNCVECRERIAEAETEFDAMHRAESMGAEIKYNRFTGEFDVTCRTCCSKIYMTREEINNRAANPRPEGAKE